MMYFTLQAGDVEYHITSAANPSSRTDQTLHKQVKLKGKY
jgi:hypothetical protein